MLDQRLLGTEPMPVENSLLHIAKEGGFTIIEPANQIKDNGLPTVVIVSTLHLNEHNPAASNERVPRLLATTDQNGSLVFQNVQVQALSEMIEEFGGALPFNVKIIADPLAGLDLDGQRQKLIPNFEVGRIDPNRVADEQLQERIDAFMADQIPPRVGPLAPNIEPDPDDILAEQELMLDEAHYRMVQNRIQDLALHILQNYPDSIVVTAHADKLERLLLEDIDEDSFIYNYYHAQGWDAADIDLMHTQYIRQLMENPLLKNSLKIAQANYIIDQNPPIQGPNTSVHGGVYLTELDYDGSLECFLGLNGIPMAIAQELQDDLSPEQKVEVVKVFYRTILKSLTEVMYEPLPAAQN